MKNNRAYLGTGKANGKCGGAQEENNTGWGWKGCQKGLAVTRCRKIMLRDEKVRKFCPIVYTTKSQKRRS